MNLSDFTDWLKTKFTLDAQERVHQIKQGEVYWCALGVNVGDEEHGKGERYRRPVLVLKKFNNNIFIGVPMSTRHKINPYYLKVLLKDVEQSVMISQLRVMDTKRLDSKIGYISKQDLLMIKTEVKKFFD
jgi:mRNA interferase MazF